MKINLSSALSLTALIGMFIVPTGADAATIYACEFKPIGIIRIVNASTACRNHETVLSWERSAATLPHFVDNGDGTVTDNKTGLMWEKKDGTCAVAGPHCWNNTYTWSSDWDYSNGDQRLTKPTGTLYSDFLAQLNDLLTPNDGTATPCFVGYCDWRIPTISELRSIVSAPYPTCASGPCIDSIFGPTQTGRYWSSSPWAVNPEVVWNVQFGDSQVGIHVVNGSYAAYARAVRGGH